MVQSMVNLDEKTNKEVLDYSEKNSIPKYEAIIALIKLGLKAK